jgi:hypothetical protein
VSRPNPFGETILLVFLNMVSDYYSSPIKHEGIDALFTQSPLRVILIMRAALILAFAGSSLAFPAVVLNEFNARAAETAGCPFAAKAALLKRQVAVDVTFDLTKQKVDTSGQYAFVPPKAGDQRVSVVCLCWMPHSRLIIMLCRALVQVLTYVVRRNLECL